MFHGTRLRDAGSTTELHDCNPHWKLERTTPLPNRSPDALTTARTHARGLERSLAEGRLPGHLGIVVTEIGPGIAVGRIAIGRTSSRRTATSTRPPSSASPTPSAAMAACAACPRARPASPPSRPRATTSAPHARAPSRPRHPGPRRPHHPGLGRRSHGRSHRQAHRPLPLHADGVVPKGVERDTPHFPLHLRHMHAPHVHRAPRLSFLTPRSSRPRTYTCAHACAPMRSRALLVQNHISQRTTPLICSSLITPRTHKPR